MPVYQYCEHCKTERFFKDGESGLQCIHCYRVIKVPMRKDFKQDYTKITKSYLSEKIADMMWGTPGKHTPEQQNALLKLFKDPMSYAEGGPYDIVLYKDMQLRIRASIESK